MGVSGRVIGRSVRRKEDRPLLTGQGCFVDDLELPDAAQVTIVRSPEAHARIAGIDVAAARAANGVIDVVTAEDLPGDVRIPMRMFVRDGMDRFLQPPLAREAVRYSGEPVAVVLAESRYLAEDAAELVEVDYEPLEPVLDAERALQRDAPALHERAGTNLATALSISKGDTEAAFAAADLVIEERLSCQRHGAVPLEPRGLVAHLNDRTGRLNVWGAAKIIHVNRRILAGLLDWPVDRIRFVELDVGGGFGGRGEFYPEDYLIPFCAVRSGRPVAWTADREEELRSLNHSREQTHDMALALRSDGTLLAFRDSVFFDTGAYVRTHGANLPTMSSAYLPGPYRWEAFECTVRQVITNKTPAGTYRAPGRYETNFVRERMIDIAARRLGRDPAELRRQNLVPPEAMPYDVGTRTGEHPVAFDSGDYPLLLEKGMADFDYEEMRRWREEDPGPDRRRGLGLAMFVEKSGIGGWEWAKVALAEGGRTVVHVGSASVGQGVRTVLAQVCADELGVRYEDVEVVHGDTDTIPDGMGAFGSRATPLGGAAVMVAAGALRERLLELAASELEADPGDLVLEGDRVQVRGTPAAHIPLATIARRAVTQETGSGDQRPLEEEHRFETKDMSYPYGVHCVAVEVDVETGGIEIERYGIAYDIGVGINPQLLGGQMLGGLAQGIGGALLEEFAYDAAGQLVTASFMDYLIPTALEVPPAQVLVTEDAPSPLTPLGAKGGGEGGTSPVGAVIANAVSDALGVEALALPLTPQRVLEHARAAAGGQAG
jgi:CO/xanthine dehydrogenase Mo-binding subunit